MTASPPRPAPPSVAAQIRALAPSDVRAGLRGRVEPWALVQSLGPIRRDCPHVLAVTVGSQTGEQTGVLFMSLDPRQLRRWDGYGLTMLGRPLWPDQPVPTGAPVLELAPDDGGPTIRLLLLSQWATAEHTDVVAWARWSPERQEILYGDPTRTVPLSYRDGLLLAHGEQLLELVTTRGRPLETPLRARARLATAEAGAHHANLRGRAGLADAAGLSTDGLDSLKRRTTSAKSAAIRNKTRISTPGAP